jgi:lipoate-protein ligase A
MGNTNFSIILPRLLFTRSHGAELVAKAVRDRLDIAGCTVNERNDVVVHSDGKDFKVSPGPHIRAWLTAGVRIGVQDHPAPGIPPRYDADIVLSRGAGQGAQVSVGAWAAINRSCASMPLWLIFSPASRQKALHRSARQ